MRTQGKNVIHADFAISDVSAFMPDAVKANGGFDVVHFTQVLEHVVKPAQFLANACLALRPGGLLHLDVPNDGGLTALARKLNPFSEGCGEITPTHHMIAYNKNTMQQMIEAAGFVVDDIFACAYDDSVFGLAHAHLLKNGRLGAAWKASALLGLGGNLVALAHKPLS